MMKKKNNIQRESAYMCLKEAFRFFMINVHSYPDYISFPITIWRENKEKVSECVHAYGENMFII
jgi:hypothetical protein